VPPLASAFGRRVFGVERIGKRVVLGLEGELFVVIHLMIAGRLRWLAPGKATAGPARAVVAPSTPMNVLVLDLKAIPFRWRHARREIRPWAILHNLDQICAALYHRLQFVHCFHWV